MRQYSYSDDEPYVNSDVVDYLRSNGITKLYHFTDRSNIKSIIDNGGLYSWKSCDERGISIPRPGGDSSSRSLDDYRGLGKYVRLSFTRNHPMMYVAKNERRIDNPVILEIDLSVAGYSTTKFSDRNATKNGAIIETGYDGAKNIHFSTVKQPDQFNLSPYEKEFYQAEVLVYDKIPLSCITNIDRFRPAPQITRTTTTSGSTSSGSSYRPSTSTSKPSNSSSSQSSSSSSGNFGCLIPIITVIIIGTIIALLEP